MAKEVGPRIKVAAIGASAGGLEALERLFRALPATVPAAFVVIQHLSSDHKSLMEDLLARHTELPIHTVTDGMLLRPGHVYLIPPGRNLGLEGDALRLTEKQDRGLNLPIDRFFEEAARELRERLVAVILSGTGSDGSRGARVVNAMGGLVLAQTNDSAKFDGMPRSVVATGVVDEVLDPEGLGERIARFASGGAPVISDADAVPGFEDPYEAVIAMLAGRSKIDFGAYKRATLLRRIDRRVTARNLPDVASYLTLLARDDAELVALRRDMLIGVTRFFRDREAFARLEEIVLPAILERPRSEAEVRIWVAGCATGEEAYSIAMLLDRVSERIGVRRAVKIFATDVDPAHLEQAQAGVFGEGVTAEFDEPLLERYLVRDGTRLTVHERIRRDIIFARHDLVSDPPFTRLDLVSCRNTLIYLRPETQARVLSRFQYGLGTGGWLFLGSSESVGAPTADFEVVDSRARIWRCMRSGGSSFDLTRAGPLPRTAAVPARERRARELELARQMVLDAYAPPSLLVSPDRAILHVFGDASRLLQVRPGDMSVDFSRLLPPRLSAVAVSVALRARKARALVRAEAWLDDGMLAQVEARVLPAAEAEQALVLLSFLFPPVDAEVESADRPVLKLDAEEESSARIRELEEEVISNRHHLQATIEELEASNEELQAANEELLASNEELQSTNEELQSLNEELYTVNAEHQEKIEILRALNADLDVMARATGIPMLFLDARLCITRFTPSMTRFVSVGAGDLGRPLSDFMVRLDAPWLFEALEQAQSSGVGLEREVVASTDGRRSRYLLRAMPYAVGDVGLPGLALTLLDVTAAQEARTLQQVLDGMTQHVALLDSKGNIVTVNAAWDTFARRNGDPHLRRSSVGANYLDAIRPDDEHARAAAEGLRAVLDGRERRFRLEYPCHAPEVQRWFVMDALSLAEGGGGLVVTHQDVTPWVEKARADAP